MKYTFPTGKAPQIIVTECFGELVIKVQPEMSVIVRGDDKVTAEAKPEAPEVINVSGRSSLVILAPENASLLIHSAHGNAVIKGILGDIHLEEVHGDLTIKRGTAVTVGAVHGGFFGRDFDGALTVNEVNGDLNMRNTGGLQIGTVHGDIRGRNINGAVTVGQGYGDIIFSTVNESVSITTCLRDVNLKNVAGQVLVEKVEGDIRLYDSLGSGKHHLTAVGDVIVRWPANAPLQLTATAPEVTTRLPLTAEQRTTENGQVTLTGYMGEGDTHLFIQSDGRIILKNMPTDDLDIDMDISLDFGNFGSEVSKLGERITNELGQRLTKLSQKLEARFSGQTGEDIAQRTEQAMERVMRHTEEAIRRAESQINRPGRPMRPMPPVPPVAPVPPAPQASSAAQLKVLEMVEKGTISVEDANVLLKALE